MGTVTAVASGPEVRLLLDKAVPCEVTTLYRVDQVSGPSAAMAYCNLADLCASDSEKQVLCLVNICRCTKMLYFL